MSVVIGQKPIEISEPDWQRIESQYGQQLSSELRQQIQKVTQVFASSAMHEVTAAPVFDARKAIKKLSSAAGQLRDLVAQQAGSGGGQYAIHLLMNSIRNDRLGDPKSRPYQDPIKAFSEVISSFVMACEQSLNELKDPNRGEFREGEAWDEWVCKLGATLEASDLPTAARKDSDKQRARGASPFVALIRELQMCVPAPCRRHCSDTGLATAVARARQPASGQ